LRDLTGKELVDRLPVIVAGDGVNQLLGVPKLTSSTGEAQASAVACLIENWGLVDRIASMCFDTTSSNTGNRNGACVLLEEKLGKKLLHLACRHHIMELVLAAAFHDSFGVTSGPDVAIFKRFQMNWTNINQTRYEPGAAHEEVASLLKDDKDSLLAFSESQLHHR